MAAMQNTVGNKLNDALDLFAFSFQMVVEFPSKANSCITVTTAASQSIWVMELHNGSDNRLTRYMIEKAFLPALDYVELEWRKQWEIAHKRGSTRKAVPGSDASLQSNWKYNDSARLDFDSNRDDFDGSGALIITGNLSQDKYFCNGLDFYEATSQENFFLDVFHPWIQRLATFPIPVIACINGHAFAGGWITAIASDYRVIGDWKLWACMNEVHFGSDFPLLTALFLRSSFRSTIFIRKLMLQGHRFTPQELLTEGAVDVVVSTANTSPSNSTPPLGWRSRLVLHASISLAKERCQDARTGVYGLVKQRLLHAFTFALEQKVNLPLIKAEDENRKRLQQLQTQSLGLVKSML